THGAHQYHESWTYLPAHVFIQRNQPGLDRIPLWMLAVKLFRQNVELCLRATDSSARLKPSDDRHCVPVGFLIIRQRPGNKGVDRRAGSKDAGEVERC